MIDDAPIEHIEREKPKTGKETEYKNINSPSKP